MRRAVDGLVADARAREPAATVIAKDVAADAGGELHELEFRLKTPASAADKASRALAAGRSLEEALGRLNDLVRYTIAFPDSRYAEAAQRAVESLEAQGTVRVVNFWRWSDATYIGINVTVRSRDAGTFEVQFHTSASLAAREDAHSMYEQARDLPRRSDVRRLIDRELAARAKRVSRPAGVERIRDDR